MRALLTEFQLPFNLCPTVVPIVKSVLNNSPLDRLGGRCSGSDRPMLSINHNAHGKPHALSVEEVHAKKLLNTENALEAVDGMSRRQYKRREKC